MSYHVTVKVMTKGATSCLSVKQSSFVVFMGSSSPVGLERNISPCVWEDIFKDYQRGKAPCMWVAPLHGLRAEAEKRGRMEASGHTIYLTPGFHDMCSLLCHTFPTLNINSYKIWAKINLPLLKMFLSGVLITAIEGLLYARVVYHNDQICELKMVV